MTDRSNLTPEYFMMRGMIDSLEAEHREQAMTAHAEVLEILNRGEAYALGVALAMIEQAGAKS